jgi:3-hydroxyacyl-CoA dehydrogenase/enoyl-CoA hydratase/3-hydroxybutyryl-CoA epimerase/3-hydroxyacyl-CoA dehydrogenase/enoyl-CoA hydratase/3-hydroxybutyryl-CoA epimerase/enoyl-CoA isomerase
MMGTAIAAAHVARGLPVAITDSDADALAKAPEAIVTELIRSTGASKAEAKEAVGRLVHPTCDDARIAQCHLVIESVVETLAIKQQVYARLKPHLDSPTILATNTSTIPIAGLAAELHDPGRFCGLHFFHPVQRRPLVEIVRGPSTRDETVAAAVGHAKVLRKTPIVAGDGPGFVVNRLLVSYLNEALEMLREGAAIEQVERAAVEFGMAMGPFSLLDEIGLDTAMLAGRVLWEAFPDRIVASPLLISMLKKGRLGRKSGAGFLSYPGVFDGPGRPDPSVDPIIAPWIESPRRFNGEMIRRRLILPMVLEATRLVEENKVRDPRDVDLSVIFGLGFPAARGGLLYWADALGASRIVEMLRPLEPLGERLRPTRLLLEMAESRRRFYHVSLPWPSFEGLPATMPAVEPLGQLDAAP